MNEIVQTNSEIITRNLNGRDATGELKTKARLRTTMEASCFNEAGSYLLPYAHTPSSYQLHLGAEYVNFASNGKC